MNLRIALALAALLGATGCWIDACEAYDATLRLPACREELVGPFSPVESGPGGWCDGNEAPMTTCRSLGYTVSCQDLHVRPEAADSPVCR